MDTAYVRDLFKLDNNLGIEKFYCGKTDYKYEKSICVYNLQNEAKRNICIGGEENTIGIEKFTVLIRWNKNYIETENAAKNIYNYLTTIDHLSYNNIDVNYVELLNNSPIDVHCGDDGIYERVIDFRIYYKENKK